MLTIRRSISVVLIDRFRLSDLEPKSLICTPLPRSQYDFSTDLLECSVAVLAFSAPLSLQPLHHRAQCNFENQRVEWNPSSSISLPCCQCMKLLLGSGFIQLFGCFLEESYPLHCHQTNVSMSRKGLG